MSFIGFGGFSMTNFARVMCLFFGSAGAHTYPKSGQVAPQPSPTLSLRGDPLLKLQMQ